MIEIKSLSNKYIQKKLHKIKAEFSYKSPIYPSVILSSLNLYLSLWKENISIVSDFFF